ncbi:MAG: hypothetical protein AB1349_05470 [Elusimicrobiota bacterium]
MTKKEFYNRITNSSRDILAEFLKILNSKKIDYCAIGGIAVNAYCEPLITLDFDCVIAIKDINQLKKELKTAGFKIKTHPHTWEVKHRNSDIKIQLQRDKRYGDFIKRARIRNVLGYKIKVAKKEDVLKGKIWAYTDPERNKLKREKDALDIKRLIKKYPALKRLVKNVDIR